MDENNLNQGTADTPNNSTVQETPASTKKKSKKPVVKIVCGIVAIVIVIFFGICTIKYAPIGTNSNKKALLKMYNISQKYHNKYGNDASVTASYDGKNVELGIHTNSDDDLETKDINAFNDAVYYAFKQLGISTSSANKMVNALADEKDDYRIDEKGYSITGNSYSSDYYSSRYVYIKKE